MAEGILITLRTSSDARMRDGPRARVRLEDPAATPALNPDARMLVERASDMPGRCGRVCRRHVYATYTRSWFSPAASCAGDKNTDKMHDETP